MESGVAEHPASVRIRWNPACRIVPTRFPTIYLFDRIADPADFEALYQLEALTNDRIREETGQVERVAPEDRIVGPGSGPIMAAFTHVPPDGSRFSDGSAGVFYAARDRATAVAETRYHQSRFLAATHEAPMHLQMRLYHVRIDATLHDLRLAGDDIHDPDDYGPARALAARLRSTGSPGVVYRSVRRPQGQCVGLFKPRGARDCVHAAYLLYAWNGAAIDGIYERTDS